MQITILGCGPSAGVPNIHGNYGKCNPNNTKNIRTRPTVFIEYNGLSILIDCGPDIKQQILRDNIKSIDIILLTHEHFDHILGLSDLRKLFIDEKKVIPVYSDRKTLKYADKIHQFVFENIKHTALFMLLKFLNNLRKIYKADNLYNFDSYRPYLKPVIIKKPLVINNLTITPFLQIHGPINFLMYSLGFRFDIKENNKEVSWAYSNDVVNFNKKALDHLQNLDLWIIDCNSITPKKTHAHLAKVLDWVDELQPKKTVLINMGSEMDYDYMLNTLPSNIEPSFDGMKIYL